MNQRITRRLWTLQARGAPYFFLLPFVLLFATFTFFPLVRSLWLSLHKSAGPRYEVFVGLDNYRFLLRDRLFWWSVLNTSTFTAAFLVLQLPISLGLALLLNNPRVRARSFFRFAFFSTYLVGPVFVAVLFSSLLNQREGLVNRLIALVRPDLQPDWLGDPRLTLVSLVLAALWLSVGFGMIYFLAALQAVDAHLYEAAAVDGASRWSRLWHVTLPGIRPVLVLMILIGTIAGLQLFELPYVLFAGSPATRSRLTIVMYLFVTGFEAGDLGYASAIGWVLVLLLLGVTITQLRVSREMKDL
jgi:ABC-type sugar transport system permease subunit